MFRIFLHFFIVTFTLLTTPYSMEAIDSTEPLKKGAIIDHIFHNKEFLEQQHELIKDKELHLYGIALFSGADAVSGMIRKLTNSSWSHVGLMIRDHKNEFYCFESTSSYDEIMHQGITPQVRISPWNTALQNYNGTVAFRQLFTYQYQKTEETLITPIVQKYIGRPYECDVSSLIEALSGSNKSADISSIFCSELVAEVLQESKFLSDAMPSNNYLPKHFSTEVKLELLKGTLGDENLVKGYVVDKGSCFGKQCCTIL